jgi:hypothetical protein
MIEAIDYSIVVYVYPIEWWPTLAVEIGVKKSGFEFGAIRMIRQVRYHTPTDGEIYGSATYPITPTCGVCNGTR